MPQSGTYGSVGAAGGQPPAATRPVDANRQVGTGPMHPREQELAS